MTKKRRLMHLRVDIDALSAEINRLLYDRAVIRYKWELCSFYSKGKLMYMANDYQERHDKYCKEIGEKIAKLNELNEELKELEDDDPNTDDMDSDTVTRSDMDLCPSSGGSAVQTDKECL